MLPTNEATTRTRGTRNMCSRHPPLPPAMCNEMLNRFSPNHRRGNEEKGETKQTINKTKNRQHLKSFPHEASYD